MRKLLAILIILPLLAACDQTDSRVATENLRKAAEMFELNRRVVFVNGITDKYILSIEGRCDLQNNGRRLSVVCRVGKDLYKRHFLGLSDNVTYFSEQLDAAEASSYHYRVIFKPQTIVPDVDFRGSAKELAK